MAQAYRPQDIGVPKMKFSIGDPVWARSDGQVLTAGEYAGIVIDQYHLPNTYLVDIPTAPARKFCPAPRDEWPCHESTLRPRRDDYQQHEGLGRREDLTTPVAPDLCEESLAEAIEEYLAGA